MAAHQDPDVQAHLNHAEAQRILREESLRVGDQDLSTFFQETEDIGLEGEPLSLKQVRKLCPNYFVRNSRYLKVFQRFEWLQAFTPWAKTKSQKKGEILIFQFVQPSFFY